MNLINELDKAIAKLNRANWEKHHPKTAHYVTDYLFDYEGTINGKSCLRKQYYDWNSVPPIWEDIESKRLYGREFGKYVQRFMEDLLMIGGYAIKKEVSLPEIKIEGLKYPMHGRIDDILLFADLMYMLEIKSCHGRKFNSKQFGIMYHGADIDHKYQVAMYKKYYPDQMDEYHLLYFSREDFNRREFIAGDNLNLPEEFDFKYWKLLEEYLERKQLPPRGIREDAAKGEMSWLCQWCDYKTLCYEVHKNI